MASFHSLQSSLSDQTEPPEQAEPRLFPLPVSPFEHSMLIDDRPSHPMTSFVHCQFRNHVHLEPLSESLSVALRRHPLLRCRIEYQRRMPHWIPAPEAAAQVQEIQSTDQLWTTGGDFIDLTRQTGLRIWLLRQGGDSEIWLQFHHACCDGLGALQFLADLASEYALRTQPETVREAVQTFETYRLLTRHHSLNRRGMPKTRSLLLRARGIFREYLKHLKQKPVPLALPNDGLCVTRPGEPQIQSHTLDRNITRQLRNNARLANATVNDILLRDLLLTLDQWNRQHRAAEPGRDFRILMPMNLRAEGDEFLPSTNLIGYAFITRHPRDLLEPARLLSSITHDTEAIKTYRLGWLWLDALARLHFLKLLPVASRLFHGRCQATAVHSHLGNAIQQFESRFTKIDGHAQIGNILLTRMTWIPPLRPLTRVAVATSTGGGELTVNVRCDPNHFTQEHTQQFLRHYIDHLTRTANSADLPA